MANLTTSGTPTFNGDSTTTIDSTGSDRVQAPVTGMNTTQGWFAIRLKMAFGSATALTEDDRYLFSWADDANNLIYLSWRHADVSWAAGRKAAGVGTAGGWLGDTFLVNDKRTIILRWSATEWAIRVSGGSFASLGNTNIPALSATLFDIGQAGAANQIGCPAYWAAWGADGSIDDTDGATIDAFGDTDTAVASFPKSCVAVWPAVTAAYNTAAVAAAPKHGLGGAVLLGLGLK